MDCEKFETTLIDELYGELDELTSAASKRHMAGCARCAALLGGLRATRRVAALPVVAPSDGFEARILAATREARASMKPKLGFAQIISWAGQWAMRPQTAMAAVFLLMVGTSGVLLTRKSSRSSSASSGFAVTENGAPDVPAAARSPSSWIDPGAAAAAHGEAPRPPAAAAAPMAAASALPLPSPTAADERIADLEESKGSNGPAAYARRAMQAAGAPADLGQLGGLSPQGYGPARGGGAYAPRAIASKPAPIAQAREQQPFAPPPPPASSPLKKDDAFATGRSQYSQRDFSGAQQTFDGLASQGDAMAALWAARSVRDGSGGCSAAAARFDQVAGQAWGTNPGYDATLEGGECYRALGQPDAARTRFARLLTVPAYASRAQADIDAMSQIAAKAHRSIPKAAAAAPAGPPPAATPPAQAAPAEPSTLPSQK